MVLVRDGASVSRKDRSRPILSLRDGSNGSSVNALLGGEQSTHSESEAKKQRPLTEAERFEAMLWAERNAWSVRQNSLGLSGGRRIGKREAERKLGEALARLHGGGRV